MTRKICLAALFVTIALALPLLAAAQDTDGDLMPDTHELLYPCLNVNLPDGALDYDSDSMTSLQEYQYSPLLNPCVADTDGDGVNDGIEVANGANPLDNTITPIFQGKIGSDVRLTYNSNISNFYSLTWTGSEFGVCWYDNRDGNFEIYFARVSSSGVKIGTDLRVTSAAGDGLLPSVSWTGSEFGVSWEDSRDGNVEIYFARVSDSGVKLGSDLRVTSNVSSSEWPSLSWTGSEFGVSWHDYRDGHAEIYFARVSYAGAKIGSDIRETNNATASYYPSLSWTGSEFGVNWQDYRAGNPEIYFVRISTAGVKIGSDLRVTFDPSTSYSPSLVWSGSEFGASWKDSRNGNEEIYFARVSAAGAKIGDDLRVAPNSSSPFYPSPSLVWTGGEYAVSWHDYRDGNYEIYLAIISSAGLKIGDDLRVTSEANTSEYPSLVWTGSEFGVGWRDNRDVNMEIYFARIRASDRDGDGLVDGAETGFLTNPADWDTDDDGMPDGWEVQYSSCVNPIVGDSLLDPDADILPNLAEYQGGTNPCVTDIPVDTDGDGLSDNYELYISHTNPLVADTDGDGLNDGYEVNTSHTEPLMADTDGDGLSDGYEVNTYNTNPLVTDTDGDGLSDGYEVNTSNTNPLVTDTDSDGMTDGWEVTNGLNPLVDDAGLDEDGDGLTNLQEFNLGTKANDADTDDDSMPDGWEFAQSFNPLVNDAGADADADGLPNLVEYTAGTDPHNADTDEDGMTDGYEVINGIDPLTDDSADDLDGDGLTNLQEFTLGTKANNSDTDNDGLSDGEEINACLTDPLDPDTDDDGFNDGFEVNLFQTNPLVPDADTDADGLPDVVETNTGVFISPANTGTSPSNADTDGDGVGDGDEVVGGSNPIDARIVPGVKKLGTDLRVTCNASSSYDASLIWTGSEFGVSWYDYRDGNSEIYFARVSSSGVKIGSDLRVTSAASDSAFPSLSWTGSEFGVSWVDTRDGNWEIYFARVSAAGVKLGSDLRVTSNASSSDYPSLTWTGSEFGVSWQDTRDVTYASEIYFARVSSSGVKLGLDFRVTNNSSYSFYPSLAWTGSEFMVSWSDYRNGNWDIYFARISDFGTKIGSDLQVTSYASGSYQSSYPSLTWTGSEFGVSWEDYWDGNDEIYFARVSGLGAKIGLDLRVTSNASSSDYPSLTWTGSEFGVSWYDNRDGNSEIYFTLVSVSGAKIGSDLRVTSNLVSSEYPCLTWTGSEFGVSWTDNYEIYFSRIGMDRDGDGLYEPEEAAAGTNPADWDTDDDTMPDGWEVSYLSCINPLIGDSLADADTDGLSNLAEYNLTSNPCNPDTDGDGLIDGDEMNIYLTDPLDPDTDNDGLGDGLELNTYLTNPLGLDTDGDGVGDGDEVSDGSNPLDARIVPQIIKLGSDLRVTSYWGYILDSDLIWTGSEFGVSWVDSRDGNYEIYFARISTTGAKIGSDLRVSSDSAYSEHPSLTWTGSEFAVSWDDNYDYYGYDICFARVSASGAKIGADLQVSLGNYQGFPSLIWTGSEFGVSWEGEDNRDGKYEIYFARISSTGEKIGLIDYQITENLDWYSFRFPSLVWTGSEYGVSWYDNRDGNNEIYFARISATGEKIGPDLRETSSVNSSDHPSLAWTGSEYGIAWHGSSVSFDNTYFSRISPEGSMINSAIQVNESLYSTDSTLIWTGLNFGIAWQDQREGNNEIYFAQVFASGAKLEGDLRVTSDANVSQAPSLTWTGSEYGVSWTDYRDGNAEIYFARIGVDRDGDGLNDTEELAAATNPADWDTDDDKMPDGWEYLHRDCVNPIVGDSLLDSDHDGLRNLAEYDLNIDPCDTDSDDDGLGDRTEVTITHTDPTKPDTDGDGLKDGPERMSYHTDPLDADSDDDQLEDGDEVLIYMTDPLNPDTDGDGLMDGVEVHVYGTNPLKADTDDDGLADGQEVNVYGTDPTNPDTDGDLLGDGEEVFTYQTTPALWDSDTDMLGDGEEIFLFNTSPLDPDSDADGLGDGDEVFNYLTDPLLWDTDGDAMPDGWEVQYSSCVNALVGDALLDPDADGVTNLAEYQGGSDPCVADIPVDSDSDGLTDTLEASLGTNPNDPDSDDDGVNDGAEYNVYHTNPLGWDSDGDALPDSYEIAHLASIPPLDPNSASDGATNFDADGNANAHEYWNGSDPWTNQAIGGAGCYYWGDSGAGDGVVGPSDAVELQKVIIGIAANYAGVLPNTGETQELNMDGAIGPSDFIVIQKMILSIAMPSLGSRPVALDVIESPGAPILVGNTCHVTVAVRNEAGLYTPGLGVIFEIVSGPGTATLFGGDGSPGVNKRYDLSNSIAAGRSCIVLRIDSPGAITLKASIPACGTMPNGRSSAEVVLNPAAVITGQ